MISAVSNKGEMQFMVFDGAMNADIFKDFMTRPVKDSPCRVFLIVDNLRVHHASVAEKKRPRTAKALKADVVAHLSARKNEPESVRRLFHKKEVRYAAD